MKKEYYIYITTNNINNKKYIGQHYGLLNDNYFGSGALIKKAIEKYGKENFKKEIIEIVNNYDELNEREKYWINFYDAVNSEKFYNIATGGLNSNPVAGLSEEAEKRRREKLSLAAKGKNNHFYGRHFCGKEHPMYGKKCSEETKQKLRNAHLGKTLTKEHREKISQNSKNKIEVYCYDKNNNFVKVFQSKRDVMRFLGLNPSSTYRLSEAIINNKLYHGYYFKSF